MTARPVGYVRLTHLGLCSAVAAAARGVDVVAFDPDVALVDRLAAGELPVHEPGLAQLARRHEARIRWSTKAGDLAACGVVWVAPDVPTDDAGRSDVRAVDEALHIAREHCAQDATIVVLSQVEPGFTRARWNRDARLRYQVETLIFGRAVERALHPERWILGLPDPSLPIAREWREVLERFDCPILPMRFESAELAKISINAHLVAQVSVTNTLADLCERVGASWSEIAPALRLDARIGPQAYLSPGLGLAGGNVERDLATIARMAAECGADARVTDAFVAHGRHRRDWALRVLHREVLSRFDAPRIAVLGLAYKQDTASTKNSAAVELLRALGPFVCRVWDPVVAPSWEWHPQLDVQRSALGACEGATAAVLMTPWAELRSLDPFALAAALDGRVVVDPYGLLDHSACRAAGLAHFVLGESDLRRSTDRDGRGTC